MEAEVQLGQLKRLACELEEIEKKLCFNINELDAVCAGLHDPAARTGLRTQSLILDRQAGSLKDMAAVLERVGNLYEKTEESIIQAAETDARQYRETLRTVNLRDMARIPVKLN